ncbi:MAG: FkbM family methyltransferase [Rhodospirillaceae bacterium]|nr:FkbM family methyltransferase [Rhodospirillaceae bacterium]
MHSVLKSIHRVASLIIPKRIMLLAEEIYFLRKGEAELRILEALCRPQQDAIDIGANVGCYSLFLRQHAAHVYAFEPIPWMAERLVKKFAGTVTVQELALSSSAGTAPLHIPKAGGKLVTPLSSLSATKSACGMDITVRTERLDEIYQGQVGLIKIDVEGHEEAVLDGAQKTIERCRPRILIEIEDRHAPGGRERISEMFQSLAYTSYFIASGELHPMVDFDPETMQDPSLMACSRYINNFIFLPREDDAKVVGDIQNILSR